MVEQHRRAAAGDRHLGERGPRTARGLAAPGGWVLMRDYQRARIETFFATVVNPESDPFGEGYNILQARISIGSGGMFGQGWLQGTQTQLDYLRVKQSDFIFSVTELPVV